MVGDRLIAERVGCNAETLRLWVRRSKRDSGARPGLSTDERDLLKVLERENRELRQANEILRRRSSAAGSSHDHKVWRQLGREGVHVACCTVARLMRHSDRGSQYLSIRYTERIGEAGTAPSVGSVGDCHDNALAETVSGLFKTELIRRRGPWRSIQPVEFAPLEWMDWFNQRRILEPIGDIPPAEAEALFYAEPETSAVAA